MEEKQKYILIWFGSYILFFGLTVISIIFLISLNNKSIADKLEIERLESEIECQMYNERKIDTQTQIIDYLEASNKDCKVSQRAYYKWLNSLKK